MEWKSSSIPVFVLHREQISNIMVNSVGGTWNLATGAGSRSLLTTTFFLRGLFSLRVHAIQIY